MLGVVEVVVVGAGELCEHKTPKVFWTYGPKKFYELRANHAACVANASGSASPPRSQVQVECLNFCPGSFFFPRVSGKKPLFSFLQALYFFFQGLPLLIGMSLLGWIPFIKPFPEGFAETATEIWRLRISRKLVVDFDSCETMFLKYRVLE